LDLRKTQKKFEMRLGGGVEDGRGERGSQAFCAKEEDTLNENREWR